jgi:nucleotide-binding universal stress UspA family protein
MYRPTITVGVGGRTGWQALAWAQAEAITTDARLVVCHICPADSALATRAGATPLGVLELADPALARALAAVKTRLGGHRVDLTVHTGRIGPVLVRESTHGDLLVVGAGDRYSRTASYAAAHAHCPVAAVRPQGDAAHGPFGGHVVVGVDATGSAHAAMEFAFQYACTHRRPLAAVHVGGAADTDFCADDTVLETHFTAEPAALEMLATEIEPWTHKYPVVGVKRAVFAGAPLPGLLRAGAGAPLLVVGARRHGPAARMLLGSVSRGVVERADGCVAVVPTDTTWHPDPFAGPRMLSHMEAAP